MKKIVFMGTPDFAVPVLESILESGYQISLVVTQPDRPRGRKRQLTPPPVKAAALKHDIPVFQPEVLREDYNRIIAEEADLIVTVAYGQLLPNELLEAPIFGAINVHASLLPELRGGAPIHYAILEGKKETGITIMYMVEQLDAGDILTQATVDITRTDNVGTLHDKLAPVGASLLQETLPKLFNKELQPIAQDESKMTYASNISREQEWIDWSQSAETIYNQIRGLCPWPVAYTKYQGNNMKIWGAKEVSGKTAGSPGEIVSIVNEDAELIVAAGDGAGVIITDIQPAGSRRMSVKDYLLGAKDRLEIGVILGVKL